MSKFENVTAVKEANIYYDGKVTSRTLEFSDGTIKSLGIMLPGEYTFGTNEADYGDYEWRVRCKTSR